MDPALRELLRNEPADRVVEAIIRFRWPGVELPGVRVVARFGCIATCRLPLAAVPEVRAHPDVVSLKAARPLGPEGSRCGAHELTDPARIDADRRASEQTQAHGESPPGRDVPRRPDGLSLTGACVVVGVVDWGLDVDHPNFKCPDGSTRLIALWDQRSAPHRPPGTAPEPYGYGTLHTREGIDRALQTGAPFQALGYFAADADRGGGAHGTHVMDIAAGNGTIGPIGMAPEADLVFVHLADRGTGGLANLGDSVRLLEAVDFIARTAGERPWVINLSMGRHGGPHDGTTLAELALDELLSAAPGRFLAQSGGNYYQARTHATGIVEPGRRKVLRFVTDPADPTPNELEIWYDGADELAVRIDPPGTRGAPAVLLGDAADVVVDGQVVGRIYHRACDPNNCDHHVDAFLYPWAPTGEWRVTLEGRRVGNGRFHAWLERDDSCPNCQPRFVPADASPECTTGTIANGHLPLVVGAYDARSPFRPPGRSSSAGPTRDDRCKPDLAARGVDILAARSAPSGSERSPGLLVCKTGTSMAAPQVTGAAALVLQYAGPRLGAAEVRRLVLSTTDPPARDQIPGNRLGRGYLNVPALLTALRQQYPPEPEVAAMERDHITPLAPAPARVYRELLYRPTGSLSAWLDRRFTILARPGQRLRDPLEVGDVVLRAVLGQLGARGDCAVVAEPGLTRRLSSEPDEPSGWYAVASIPGSAAGSRSVRVLDPAGVVPPGQLLLRTRPPGPDREPDLPDQTSEERGCGCGCGASRSSRDSFGEADGPSDQRPWQGTAEQKDFRARVLAEHIARSRRANGAPKPDLREDELSDVPGTCRGKSGTTECVRTVPATAEAAGRLLKAANADLATAQKAGDPDALRTVRLSATSGYRGSDDQKKLWLGYFANKYYDQTDSARAKIADGPHSDAAVDYMLRSKAAGGYGIGGRIAAPRYSNHQGGIAIDLWQNRTKGNDIGNDSDDPSRCRWRHSWFHGWLRTHAATYGFQPIATEEWHWEFRPNVKTTSDLTDHRGGKLWTFASRTLPQPVAVFCPKAALGRRDVDVLVFAHGLLGGCPRPKRVPAGFVTDPPFELGRVVDESGRPVVLVVPLLDWSNPCGQVVFGRGHERRHPLGKPAVLNAVVSEVLTEVGRVQGAAAPTLRELVVAGHSRAYDVLEPLAASRTDAAMGQGALARLSQVWAFDTTYAGDVAAWTEWLTLNPSLELHLYYRPGSPTGTVGDRFYAQRGDRLVVTRVKEVHCAVPATRLAELMPRPAAATHFEEEPYEAAHDAELEPFDAEFGALDGSADVEDLDTVDAADAEAALDPDLSATHGLDGADPGYGEEFDDSDDSDDELTLETTGSP
jgi:subtilisin family serine protease/LAS superfamily LD-carboxypeptidase LdcB